jgi:hypothetical protein
VSPVRTAPARLIARQDARRMAYLGDVLRLLYPQPPGPDGGRDYLVVPHARAPRMLVPAGSRRVAAAAVRRYADPQSRRTGAQRAAVVAALRTGASRVLFRDRVRVGLAGSIDLHLRDVLGETLVVNIHIGAARANRKPVLQLLDPAGEAIGFAKVGSGPLTRRLVRAETTALTTLSHVDLRHLRVPQVRHAGEWRGHRVLVQSALPVWRARSVPRWFLEPPAEPDPARLAAAMREVALCCGTTTSWLATSAYWKDLKERVAAVAAHPEGAALMRALAALRQRAGETTLRFGAWHGDWSPWNMTVLPDTLLVWDWERFAVGVPLGFDAVHYALQRAIGSGPDAAGAVAATLARAGDLVAPFDVPPAAREVTALLYLTDLAARYLTDRQAEAGARLGVLGTWLLPVLLDRLEGI